MTPAEKARSDRKALSASKTHPPSAGETVLDLLPEDAVERAYFDKGARMLGGEPLAMCIATLRVWAKMNPDGSMGAQLTILHNELVKALAEKAKATI